MQPPTIKQEECLPDCDFEGAVLKGRARWHCSKCGRDLGIEYFFWAEAAHPEWFERPKKEKKNDTR